MMLIEKLQAPPAGPLAVAELESMNAWWRAANYLSVGQVYLLANPLLREPRPRRTSSRACSGISARCRA